jgi:uncharacterized protein
MRGINISSIIFLFIILWNVVGFSLLSFMKRKSAKHKSSGVGTLGVLITNIVLIISLLYFSSNIGITHYDVTSNRLPPEFEGYKILQISDFHTGSFNGGTERLIQKVLIEKPDIIVLTGDLIDETAINLSSVNKLISQLVLIAPVYSISGNHDVWYKDFNGLKEMLKRKGVILLENEKVTLELGNSRINLFGIDDPDTWDDISSEQFLKQKMSTLRLDTSYNILLFHRANMFETIKGNGYQLVLAGHMHGGQVQIPFIGGLISPQQNRRWFPKYTAGRWEEAGTTMIVSRGLGNNVSVPRILNPPEVVAVTLKCK